MSLSLSYDSPPPCFHILRACRSTWLFWWCRPSAVVDIGQIWNLLALPRLSAIVNWKWECDQNCAETYSNLMLGISFQHLPGLWIERFCVVSSLIHIGLASLLPYLEIALEENSQAIHWFVVCIIHFITWVFSTFLRFANTDACALVDISSTSSPMATPLSLQHMLSSCSIWGCFQLSLRPQGTSPWQRAASAACVLLGLTH